MSCCTVISVLHIDTSACLVHPSQAPCSRSFRSHPNRLLCCLHQRALHVFQNHEWCECWFLCSWDLKTWKNWQNRKWHHEVRVSDSHVEAPKYHGWLVRIPQCYFSACYPLLLWCEAAKACWCMPANSWEVCEVSRFRGFTTVVKYSASH